MKTNLGIIILHVGKLCTGKMQVLFEVPFADKRWGKFHFYRENRSVKSKKSLQNPKNGNLQ
ncbi:hypothetical protein D7X87_15945 [bacterium D16-54]|nr:hypothetical protein D7X87_15945 [bacterium D16-54]RKJ14162.1 hypothetical protein D7X65_13075 [bacterium D16-56]